MSSDSFIILLIKTSGNYFLQSLKHLHSSMNSESLGFLMAFLNASIDGEAKGEAMISLGSLAHNTGGSQITF